MLANAEKYCQQYEIKGINYILTFILWVVLYVTFNLPLSTIFIGHFRSRANPEIHSSTRYNSSIMFLLKKPFLCITIYVLPSLRNLDQYQPQGGHLLN